MTATETQEYCTRCMQTTKHSRTYRTLTCKQCGRVKGHQEVKVKKARP